MFELGGYVQFDLNKTLDSTSMCFGLEVRCPFLDHRLVELALSIPEHKHKNKGNKTILKSMLYKMGFGSEFIERPKLGFSLHQQPKDMQSILWMTTKFCVENEFLKVDFKKLSARDLKYLEMASMAFYYWLKAWRHKVIV
jgi:asparagine synthetase B (glutamine-hydrolysing)